MSKFKDAGHLLRLAGVFVAGIVVFLVLRVALVPKSFGQYGHYRGDALNEVASRRVKFAGQQACEDCHSEVLATKKAGSHAGVHCEACHGPLADHVADPGSVTPKLPDTAVLCARCHEANLAKPPSFPAVATKDHAGDVACKECHKPHSPSLKSEGKKS